MSEYKNYWMLGKEVINNTVIAHQTKPPDEELEYYVHAIEYKAFDDTVNKYMALTLKYSKAVDDVLALRDALHELKSGGKLLRVPHDWDYMAWGGGPETDQLEDVTDIVEAAFEKTTLLQG